MFWRWCICCVYGDVCPFVACALVGYVSYLCVRVDLCDVVISIFVRDMCQCCDVCVCLICCCVKYLFLGECCDRMCE